MHARRVSFGPVCDAGLQRRRRGCGGTVRLDVTEFAVMPGGSYTVAARKPTLGKVCIRRYCLVECVDGGPDLGRSETFLAASTSETKGDIAQE